MSRRQTLFDAILARFKAITVSGGYETNLGRHVFAWRNTADQPFTVAELAIGAINVRDPQSQTTQGDPSIISKHHHTLTLVIEGAVQLGAEAATVRKMIADLTKAIGVDRKWSAIAYETNPGEDQILVAANGITITGFTYTFTVEFRTANFDPYTT